MSRCPGSPVSSRSSTRYSLIDLDSPLRTLPFANRSPYSSECTDHIIPLGERHLVSVLRRYATYYNESRTHLALDRNSPSPRFIENGAGEIVAIPHLGGLHHRYARAA